MGKHNETERYFSKKSTIVAGSASDENTCIRRFDDTGVYFRNFTCDSGRGGEPVEILQITDMHFNFCDAEDLRDPELALTHKCRKWNAEGVSAISAEKAMDLSKYFDKTIITGDTMDYLSHGAAEMLREYIWDVDPGALVTLGGHELTKEMETGEPDRTPLSERLAYLEKIWRHDMHYHSEVIGGKVLAVALDNSQSKYLDRQIPLLREDIDRARKDGLVILIFEHEPLSTGFPEDASVKAIKMYDPESVNYYSGPLIGSTERNDDPATREIYDMITHSADVIRGIFCGHEHSAFFTKIRAFTPDGKETFIPQPVLEGNVYDGQAGHVMRITIL